MFQADYISDLVKSLFSPSKKQGKNIEDCRNILRDALNEMILAYQQQGKEIPLGNSLIEPIPVEVDNVRKTACPNPVF